MPDADFAADLAEWIAATVDLYPDDGGDAEPATILDLNEADRALRRLRKLADDEAEILEVASALIDDTVAWRDDRLYGIERARAWVERSLEQWMRARHAETGRKTVKLPAGELRLRAPRWSVHSDDADASPELLKQLVEIDLSLVRIETSVARGAVTKVAEPGPRADVPVESGWQAHLAVTVDGQVLPGVYLVRAVEDTFKAAPSPEKTP
jgi:hypothetical protein